MLTTYRHGYRITVERHQNGHSNGLWLTYVINAEHTCADVFHKVNATQALMHAFYAIDRMEKVRR